MRKHKIFISIIIFALAFSIVNIYKNHKKEDFTYEIDPKYYSDDQSPYENDFDYIFDSLEKYYSLFERNNTKDFLAKRDKYKEEIKNIRSDDLFFTKMNSILSDLGDRHTSLVDKKTSDSFKESFLLMNDLYDNLVNMDLINYLFASDVSWENFYEIFLNKAIASTDNLLTQDINADIAYIRIGSMLDPGSQDFEKDINLLKSYLVKSKNKNALIIDLRGNGGGNSAYTSEYLYPMILGDRAYEDPSYYLLYRSDEVFKYDPQWPSLKPYVRKIKPSDYDLLEKDISFLKNDRIMMDDIKKNFTHIFYYSGPKLDKSIKISRKGINLEKRKNSFQNKYRFDGNLYLLIDKNVYSSAQYASTFFRENKLGTIIGEKSGGDGIGTSPAMFKLPNTKYIFMMSQQLGIIDADNREESVYTIPDIKVDPKYYSFINLNEDGCIKEVIKIENKR